MQMFRCDPPPLRILFVIGSMGGGGAERQVIETLKRLDRQRFQPLLYLDHRQGELLGEVPADVPITSFWDGYAGTLRSKLHYLLGLTPRARWRHLARTIRRERVDLVYDHCYLATLNAAPAAGAARVPRISVCVVDPLTEVRCYAAADFSKALELARQAYATASRVIAVSSGVRQSLVRDLGVPERTAIVHYNMLDPEAAGELAKAFDPGFATDHIHIVTVARLAPQKAPHDMLTALELLVHQRGHRNLVWHLVGDGPLKEELQSRAAQLKLTPHVDFAGFHENPYPFYQHADLFCLASTYEGFGCVLMEALACGLPVIATDCPSGPREVLDGGRYGRLVPPSDPPALAAAIEDFLADRAAAREQAAAGREFVARTFSFRAGLPKLERLFQTVVAERRRGASSGATDD